MHKWNGIHLYLQFIMAKRFGIDYAKCIILNAECHLKYFDTKICITQDDSKRTNAWKINVSNYCSQNSKILE